MLRIPLPAVTVTKTTIQCVALTEDPMATSAWLSASKTNTLKKKELFGIIISNIKMLLIVLGVSGY